MIARRYANRESLKPLEIEGMIILCQANRIIGRSNDYPVAGSTMGDELPLEVPFILNG